VIDAAILAVDGGGSKLDAALVLPDGDVLASVRVAVGRAADVGDGAGHVPAADGDGTRAAVTERDEEFSEVTETVRAAAVLACVQAGIDAERRPVAERGVYCLAGADFPEDDRRYTEALSNQRWASQTVVLNDSFAILRAGTERTWGVAVVCGTGTNCAGVAPDGRTYRLPARGTISGDWGGGGDLGAAALWSALRAEDGRGDATVLAELVPSHFGMQRPRQVTEALHFGRIRGDRVSELAPRVFEAAAAGDGVARSIIDRQADEVVTMAGAAIRKLDLTDVDVDVILGGGVFRNDDPLFFARIRRGLHDVAPASRVTVLTAPPIVGAALIGLDLLGARGDAAARARDALTHERLTAET
jgi:N-acetylglucosamine kinase-like BadF-type ATPase